MGYPNERMAFDFEDDMWLGIEVGIINISILKYLLHAGIINLT